MGFFGNILGEELGGKLGGWLGNEGLGRKIGGFGGNFLPFKHGGRVPMKYGVPIHMSMGGSVQELKPKKMKKGGKVKSKK
jgi:hypothetical protein